jgi:hypothetical protein
MVTAWTLAGSAWPCFAGATGAAEQGIDEEGGRGKRRRERRAPKLSRSVFRCRQTLQEWLMAALPTVLASHYRSILPCKWCGGWMRSRQWHPDGKFASKICPKSMTSGRVVDRGRAVNHMQTPPPPNSFLPTASPRRSLCKCTGMAAGAEL